MPNNITNLTDYQIFANGVEFPQFTNNEFRPRSDTPLVKLTLPLDWSMDPFSDRNWQFHLHAWRMLNPIWTRFFENDWNALQNQILPWVVDWHRYHIRDDIRSVFEWHDMATGVRSHHLAMIVRLQEEGKFNISKDEMLLINKLIVEHIKKLRNKVFISLTNHGIIQLTGLRLLGEAWEGKPECIGEEKYSSKMMKKLF